MLTVKYSKEAHARLKKEADTNANATVRKRCRALLAKMSEPGLSCLRVGEATGCSRNFVRDLVHLYNNEGLGSVLSVRQKPGRPGRLNGHMDEITRRLGEKPPMSRAEAAHVIRDVSGVSVGLTWTGVLLRRHGFRFRKLQPIPGKADPQKLREWIDGLQPVRGSGNTRGGMCLQETSSILRRSSTRP